MTKTQGLRGERELVRSAPMSVLILLTLLVTVQNRAIPRNFTR